MSVNQAIGKFVLISGELVPNNNISLNFAEGISVYEVIRIIKGKPLFLSDHLLRFKRSHALSKRPWLINDKTLVKELKQLIDNNDIENGNVKIVVQHHRQMSYILYQVPAFYPPAEYYKQGVICNSTEMLRRIPNAKLLQTSPKEKLQHQQNNYFETLLVNEKNDVTEGSRSNVFFVKEKVLYTAGEQHVLAGVTRNYVLSLAAEKQIRVAKTAVPYHRLNTFESAFLCGTSPKILPIQSIDNFRFNPINPLVTELIHSYDDLIAENIKTFTF